MNNSDNSKENNSRLKQGAAGNNKNYRVVLFTSLAATLVFGVIIFSLFKKFKSERDVQAQAVELIVWTHSSFMDSFGPGSFLKEMFEKKCDCTVVYVDAGGTTMALEKLKLNPNKRVDVVLGVDFLQVDRFLKSIRAQNINPPTIQWDPQVKTFVMQRAIPYDWSPMGFLYRKDKVSAAESLEKALSDLPDKSIALQDPTLSTPGLEFLYWLYTESGDSLKSVLKELKPKVHSYSPSWSTAYGLFRKNQAPVIFSYLTSLVYHWENDADESIEFMNFKSGHPVQLEYAVVPENCWSCGVAKEFVEFLVSKDAQKIIAEKNYMLPVNSEARAELNKSFQRLPEVKIIPIEKADTFTRHSEETIQLWGEGR